MDRDFDGSLQYQGIRMKATQKCDKEKGITTRTAGTAANEGNKHNAIELPGKRNT